MKSKTITCIDQEHARNLAKMMKSDGVKVFMVAGKDITHGDIKPENEQRYISYGMGVYIGEKQ